MKIYATGDKHISYILSDYSPFMGGRLSNIPIYCNKLHYCIIIGQTPTHIPLITIHSVWLVYSITADYYYLLSIYFVYHFFKFVCTW